MTGIAETMTRNGSVRPFAVIGADRDGRSCASLSGNGRFDAQLMAGKCRCVRIRESCARPGRDRRHAALAICDRWWSTKADGEKREQ